MRKNACIRLRSLVIEQGREREKGRERKDLGGGGGVQGKGGVAWRITGLGKKLFFFWKRGGGVGGGREKIFHGR